MPHGGIHSKVAEYVKIARKIDQDKRIRESFRTALDIATDAKSSPEEINTAIQKVFPESGSRAEFNAAFSGTVFDELRRSIDFYDNEIEKNIQTAFTLLPRVAEVDFADFLYEDRPEQPESLTTILVGGQEYSVSSETAAQIAASAANTGASIAQRRYEFTHLSESDKAQFAQDLFMFNNLSAAQVAQIDIALRTEGRLDDQLAFEIQNARRNREESIRQFDANYQLSALGVQAQFAGIEIERRGQMIAALGQDMANNIAIGRLTYEEANLNLNRINSAFTQMQAEREVALKYAVSKESLFERNGQLMSRLPGASQLASIMSAATGQQFTEDDFTVTAGYVNPEDTARRVLEATKFNSQIPGLRQQMDQSRQSINQILGAPLPAVILADTATDQITQGVQ